VANTRTTSTSRKPRTAARAASRPATTRRTPESEPEPEEQDVTESEAQEIEAEGQYVTAELCGEEVQIIPPSAWRSSWQRMLNQGDLDGFAEKVLAPEDYEFYLELDPTIFDFLQFTEDAARRSGESMGKSGGPAPSSRRTRRR
jgi:hypothetical protein